MDIFVPPDEATQLRATFLMDRELLRRASAFFVRKHKTARGQQLRILLISLYGAIVVALVSVWRGNLYPTGTAVAALVLLLGCYWTWRWPSRIVTAWLKMYERIPGLLGGHVVEIKPSTLVSGTHRGQVLSRLDKLHSIDVLPDMIVLSLSIVQFIAIPADADFGGETFETFAAKLTSLYADAQARGAEAKTALRGV